MPVLHRAYITYTPEDEVDPAKLPDLIGTEQAVTLNGRPQNGIIHSVGTFDTAVERRTATTTEGTVYSYDWEYVTTVSVMVRL